MSKPSRNEASEIASSRWWGADRVGEYVRGAIGAVARRAADDGAPLDQEAARAHSSTDARQIGQESESIQWLERAIAWDLLGGSIDDCTEPTSPRRLAETATRTLLVRTMPPPTNSRLEDAGARRRIAALSPRVSKDGEVVRGHDAEYAKSTQRG